LVCQKSENVNKSRHITQKATDFSVALSHFAKGFCNNQFLSEWMGAGILPHLAINFSQDADFTGIIGA
jgi:hypothetical protein